MSAVDGVVLGDLSEEAALLDDMKCSSASSIVVLRPLVMRAWSAGWRVLARAVSKSRRRVMNARRDSSGVSVASDARVVTGADAFAADVEAPSAAGLPAEAG